MNRLFNWLCAPFFVCLFVLPTSCGDSNPANTADTTSTADSNVNNDLSPQGPTIISFTPAPSQNAMALIRSEACQTHCATLTACGNDDPSCLATCNVSDSPADPSYAQFRCALASPCAAKSDCFKKPLTEEPSCTTLCADLAACGAFPSDFWGLDTTLCEQACTGMVVADAEKYGNLVQCYQEHADNGCKITEAGICLNQKSTSDSCNTTCTNLAQCGNIPGTLFLTINDCLSACEPHTPWEQLVIQTCVGSAGCERYELCFPPARKAPPLCLPFCETLTQACPDNLYFTAEVCSAFCTGLLTALPGLWLDNAITCVKSLGICPTNDQVFLCALPEPPECPTICGIIDACYGSGAECDGYCPYLGAMDPTGMPEKQRCLETVPCQAAGMCFE